jgi:chromosome segregation ATPase
MSVELATIIVPAAITAAGAGLTEFLRTRSRIRRAEVDESGETVRARQAHEAHLAGPIIEQVMEQLRTAQERITELQRTQTAEAVECARRVSALESELADTRRELQQAQARIRHLEETRG